MSPAEVKACSIWEIEAAVAGWVTANCPDEQGGMSAEDEDELWAGVVERMG